jgi:hypothetical protein
MVCGRQHNRKEGGAMEALFSLERGFRIPGHLPCQRGYAADRKKKTARIKGRMASIPCLWVWLYAWKILYHAMHQKCKA